VAAATTNRFEREPPPQPASNDPANGAANPTAAADFSSDLRVTGWLKSPVRELFDGPVRPR
jgi:hypothetical protein